MRDELNWNENQVLLAARMVREHYYPDAGTYTPEWVLVLAIRDLLRTHPASSPEELFELLITRSEIKSQGQLSRYAASSVITRLALSVSGTVSASRASVFSGSRKFSFGKLSAVVSFFTRRTENICPTKLNQLLFYSDFANFVTNGSSITGAKYLRGNDGPILHRYESVLKTLFFTGTVVFKNGDSDRSIDVGDPSDVYNLPLLELVTMTWVLNNFGSMTASEIREYCQIEGAYRFTRQDDFIAYEYARLLQKLPEPMHGSPGVL